MYHLRSVDSYSCFLKLLVINAALTALNPQPKKHKIILLVGTMYSELTTSTGMGPPGATLVVLGSWA